MARVTLCSGAAQWPPDPPRPGQGGQRSSGGRGHCSGQDWACAQCSWALAGGTLEPTVYSRHLFFSRSKVSRWPWVLDQGLLERNGRKGAMRGWRDGLRVLGESPVSQCLLGCPPAPRLLPPGRRAALADGWRSLTIFSPLYPGPLSVFPSLLPLLSGPCSATPLPPLRMSEIPQGTGSPLILLIHLLSLHP